MAHDVRDSGSQSTDPHNAWDEKDSNAPDLTAGQLDLPRNDTRSPRRGTNPTPNPSGSASRTPEESIVDDAERYQGAKPKLRTIPAWIRSVEYPEDEGEPSAADRLLPSPPDDALVAQHNHSPHATTKPYYDHARGESLSPEPDYPRRESRWKSFSKVIAYPREEGTGEKYVTPEWLNENLTDYSRPWRGDRGEEDEEDPLKIHRRREIWFRRLHNNLLRSPIVPLILRLTVWCFSLSALALGGSIQYLSGKYDHPQGPSGLMAIIVDAVALVYLVYITWDEYSSKPLGLRPPIAKARLILLDIFFIVFDSANLSLAFEALSSITGSCTSAEINSKIAPKNDLICDRQKALASVLLIALIAWLMTFSISVLRLVARVTQ